MTIFWRLLLAHLLTDFTLQFNRIAEWKRKNVWGVLAHSLIFLTLGIAFTRNYLFTTWARFPGWICLFLMFIVHFVEDYYRAQSIEKADAPDNIFFFLWDQFIHIIFIYLFSANNTGEIITEKIVIICILAIIVTHFTSILVYYIEQTLYGNKEISHRLKYKYYLILERLIIFLCLLLPKLWFITAIFVWLIYRIFQKKFNISFTKVNIIVSGIITIICAVIGRFVIY